MTPDTKSTRPTSSSPAASLPPELLDCIAARAFEDLLALERQEERFTYSQVCRSWYHSFNTTKEYFVQSGGHAHLLTARLEETNSGGQVKTLALYYDFCEEEKATALAELVLVCPNVLSIDLLLAENYEGENTAPSRHWGQDLLGAEDKELLSALEQLRQVERFRMVVFNEDSRTWVHSPILMSWSLNRLFSRWKNLKAVEVADVELHENGAAPTALPTRLNSITFDFWQRADESPRPILDIMRPSRHHLKNLRINALQQVEHADVSDLASILAGAAAQLERLEIDEGHWHRNLNMDPKFAPEIMQLAALAPLLVNLRVLKLHISFLDPHTLFDSLAQIPRLAVLNINQYNFIEPDYYPRTSLCQLNSFTAFLRRSPSIRIVQLPAPLFDTWFDEDLSHPEWLLLEKEARGRGCEIEFEY